MVAPGTTWLWLCIIVSSAMGSPDFTRSTGAWALSNQPHWVVSSVRGRRGGVFLWCRAGGDAGGGGEGDRGEAGAGAGCARAVAMIEAALNRSANRASRCADAMKS